MKIKFKSKQPKFEVSDSINKKLGQQSCFQKVWKILLFKIIQTCDLLGRIFKGFNAIARSPPFSSFGQYNGLGLRFGYGLLITCWVNHTRRMSKGSSQGTATEQKVTRCISVPFPMEIRNRILQSIDRKYYQLFKIFQTMISGGGVAAFKKS